MAVPKNKASKSRTRRRNAVSMRYRAPHLVECGSCGNLVTAHRVCPKCGSYRGRQVPDIE